MSNIPYIEQQLRNLGDYDNDGKILQPQDMLSAKNIVSDAEYNNLEAERLAYLNYTTSSVKDVNSRFVKLVSDAAKLKSGNLLAVDCNLSQGCKGISVIEGSGLDNNFLRIINVKQPNGTYNIYFLGNEIVELLVEFSANNPDITYTGKFDKIFENLITTDDDGTNISQDLKAVKQYDDKLYVARLSNKDKDTFGRYKDMANSDSDWNLQEVQELENHYLLNSSERITSINKIRFGSDIEDGLLGLLDSNTINPDNISIVDIDLQ